MSLCGVIRPNWLKEERSRRIGKFWFYLHSIFVFLKGQLVFVLVIPGDVWNTFFILILVKRRCFQHPYDVNHIDCQSHWTLEVHLTIFESSVGFRGPVAFDCSQFHKLHFSQQWIKWLHARRVQNTSSRGRWVGVSNAFTNKGVNQKVGRADVQGIRFQWSTIQHNYYMYIWTSIIYTDKMKLTLKPKLDQQKVQARLVVERNF